MTKLLLVPLAAALLLLIGGPAGAKAPGDYCDTRAPLLVKKYGAIVGYRFTRGVHWRRQCGGSYPRYLGEAYGQHTCDWGPGSSPRYTTRPWREC